jgi:microcystin-dependent protein
MVDSFIGEIRMFGGNFAPAGWALCNGAVVSIAENSALFNLIGTTYGGDGVSTFGLPDLRGRVPLHQGGAYPLGQISGSEIVTLTTQQMPIHSHQLRSATASQGRPSPTPQGNLLADEIFNPPPTDVPYAYAAYDGANQVQLSGNSLAQTGGNQPHDNMQPYLAVNFIISLFGIYPQPG